MDISSGTRWRRKEKVSILLESETFLINSCTFEQSKDIEEELLILHCKTMYCYHKNLPRRFYHVGNANELRSIVNNGLVPGGTSLKRGRQAVFFTVVNPMHNQQGLRETPMRFVTSKNRAIQKQHLETLSKYSILVQFEAHSRERTAILPNKVGRMRSSSMTHCL